MSDDYYDAASRHLQDARVLHATPTSLAGASHLFVFAAECALKSMLQTKPTSANECALKSMLQTKPTSANVVKGHLQDFWREFQSHGNLARRHAIRSQAMSFKSQFDDWEVGQRYYTRSSKCFDQAIVAKQAVAAEQLVKLAHNIRKGLIK